MDTIYIQVPPNTQFGNNLFQIFAAYYFAKENNYDIKMFPISFLDEKSKHLFKFIEFGTPSTKIPIFKSFYCDYNKPQINGDFFWHSLSQNIGYLKNLDKQEVISLLNIKPAYHNKTVLFVRGKDYLDLQLYTKRTKEYYINAIKQLNVPYEDVICCTDDIEYAKELLGDLPITYSNGTWLEDFCLGIGAKNLILTNSTFCTWAAYLSDAQTIIRPRHYYNDGFKCNTWDENWIICDD